MNRHTPHRRASTPSTTPAPSRRTPINAMSPDELHAWIQATRAKLAAKKQRERDYLDHRARRGTHTPTDEAYEADQVLLADLLAMLDEMAAFLTTPGGDA